MTGYSAQVSVQECERGRCLSVTKICENEHITTNECKIIFILDDNIITTQFKDSIIQEDLHFIQIQYWVLLIEDLTNIEIN